MWNKTKQIIFAFLAAAVMIGLLYGVVVFLGYMELKGFVGYLYVADVLAGGFALVAAWLGTKSPSSTRCIIIVALVFFIFSKIGHLSIL